MTAKRGLGLLVAPMILLSLVGALVGCTDDKASGMTKDDYLKQARKICKTTSDLIKTEAKDLDPSDPNAMTDYVAYVSAEVLAELAELRDLGFPEGDEAQLDRAIKVYELRFTVWQNNPGKAAIDGADAKFKAAGKTLEDYGLKECRVDV